MRRFRLNIGLLCIGVIGFGVLAGYLMGCDKPAWSIAALLGASLCIAMLIVLVRRVVHLTSSFVAALENNDRTMRFDIDSDDVEIKEMTASMNRIINLYRDSRLELETHKLYYDRILRVMTHEMRNSITPVIALANDYASHQAKYNPEILAETMGVIGNQAKSIKKFLDSYYSLTHLPQPLKISVEAADFCGRIRTLVDLEEKERGMTQTVCHFSVPVDMAIDVDTDLMTQAVMNILRNALDAVADVARPKIEFLLSMSDGIPFIKITDNGPGLPETVRSNLFQPFITTKRNGSGIGLSLSRQIARLHGGDLTISSSPSRGTAVTITLS